MKMIVTLLCITADHQEAVCIRHARLGRAACVMRCVRVGGAANELNPPLY